MQKNKAKREKAFLVGVILQGFKKPQINEQLNELILLAETAGADTVATVIQKRNKPP